MIKIEGLKKSYKISKSKMEVLKGIDLEINKGDFVTITGPSGSGKTTLLNLLIGIDTPDEGRVVINGLDLFSLSESKRALWRRREIGYVPQFFFLIPFLTALENVELASKLVGARDSKNKALLALESVGLKDKYKSFPFELSGGEIQRVAIARAIVHDPPIIVADEPTAYLDSENKRRIVDILEEIWKQGKTVILATHDSFLARGRIIEILDGKIRRER